MQVTLDLQAIAAISGFLTVTGTAVWWAFRRVNENAETVRLVRLLARAHRIPADSPDEEVIAIFREAMARPVEDTGQYEVLRPTPPTKRIGSGPLRAPLRREED